MMFILLTNFKNPTSYSPCFYGSYKYSAKQPLRRRHGLTTFRDRRVINSSTSVYITKKLLQAAFSIMDTEFVQPSLHHERKLPTRLNNLHRVFLPAMI